MTRNPGCGVPRLPWWIVQGGVYRLSQRSRLNCRSRTSRYYFGVIRVLRAVIRVNLSVTHCFFRVIQVIRAIHPFLDILLFMLLYAPVLRGDVLPKRIPQTICLFTWITWITWIGGV